MAKRRARAVRTLRGPRGPREPSPLAAKWIGDSLNTFAGRLETALKAKKWEAKDLAERSGISASAISRTAKGMNMWVAIALARTLGVRVGWLVASEEPSGLEDIRPSAAPPPGPDVIAIEDKVAARENEREPSGAGGDGRRHRHRRSGHQP